MSKVSDLSVAELKALARAVELWEELLTTLGRIEAFPGTPEVHIHSDMEPGYLGWIGYNENACLTFQPASEAATSEHS